MEKISVNLNIENSNKEFKEMKDKIFEDKELIFSLKRSGVTDEILNKYLSLVYSYMEDKNYCKNCPGVKKCKKENPLLSSEIFFDGKYIEQKYNPCKEVLKEMAVANNFIINDMNQDNIEADIVKMDKTDARAKLLGEFKKYLNGGQSKWLFINGSIHSGRSYLASAIANKCAKDGKSTICYLDTPFRFKELYDKSFNDLESYSIMLDKIKTCDILILDDFGNEVKNDYVRDGILSLILSSRTDKKMLTIFTSDYSIDEIEVLYATSRAGEIRARQIKNLLKSNSIEVSLGNITIY